MGGFLNTTNAAIDIIAAAIVTIYALENSRRKTLITAPTNNGATKIAVKFHMTVGIKRAQHIIATAIRIAAHTRLIIFFFHAF